MNLPDGWVMCDHCGQAWRGGLQCSCWQATETHQKPVSAVLQVVEDRTPMTRKSKPKQRSQEIIIDGIKFKSTTEGRRYSFLSLAQRLGLISNLEVQPSYVYQDSFRVQVNAIYDKPFTVAAMRYTADFRYTFRGLTVVEDAKAYAENKQQPLVESSARNRHKQIMKVFGVAFVVTCQVGGNWRMYYSPTKWLDCKIQDALNGQEMVA